jgi:hypothetical protein
MIFNSILSARLICVLDLFSPKQPRPKRARGSQIAGPQSVRAAVFLLDHEPSRCRERSSPVAKKKSNIAGVR